MDGWVKLHRCLINKPIWAAAKPEQKAVLITILCLANHEAKEWIWQGQKFVVKEGQFITSLDSLAKKSGVSKKSVRTALANFEKLEFLANESAKTGRLITVTNWALYQSQDESSANKGAMHRQSTGKAPAPNKNDKNDKNDKKEYSPEILDLTDYLQENILEWKPDARISAGGWPNTFRLMVERDKRNPDEIAKVIRWATHDSFWQSNILSADAVRRQFDKLQGQMRRVKDGR